MRKIAFILTLCALSLALGVYSPVLAAKPVPQEIKTFIIKFSDQLGNAMEELSTSLEKAQTPEQMASHINAYSDKLEPIMAEMMAMEKKYPDFFEGTDEDDYAPDADIEKASDRVDQKAEKMMESMGKVFPHAEHPAVKAALERLGKAMGEGEEEL